MWRTFYLSYIEFIELMWHNKSIKVSSVQFYYTLLVYNVVFSLFKVKSFSINTYFSLFYPFPSLIIIHFSLSMRIFLSIFFIISEELSNICQSLFSFHDSVCILFVCLFCSLYYTYKWIQVVFFFLCLISISITHPTPIDATRKVISFFLVRSIELCKFLHALFFQKEF